MSQYQDEELGRQRVLKKWHTNFGLEQHDYKPFQMFRCSRKVSLVRRKTSCSILSCFHNGIFRNRFVNGKQRERQLIHVQLVLAYSCPHLFCILKKSGKLKLLHQHFKTTYGVIS